MEQDRPQPVHGAFDWSGLTLFLISIGAIFLCGLIAWPFLPGLTWAVVLAIVAQRPHRWLRARLPNPSLAATVTLILVVLSIVVPVILILTSAGHHILDAVRGLQNGAAQQGFREFLQRHDRVAGMLQYLSDNWDLAQTLQKTAGAATGKAAALLGRSISGLVQLIVMMFVLFFLLRDSAEVVGIVRRLIPLEENEKDYLLTRVHNAVRALVLGRFVVAAVQGFVAGITYFLLGVGGALLLGVATMITALVPAVGAVVIWLPIVIYLAIMHHWVQAFILLGVGSLVISTLDNILYPILVGSHLRLHTVPIFIAMLGGVWYFGVSGLILGPVVFTIAGVLLQIWRERAVGEPLPSGPEAG